MDRTHDMRFLLGSAYDKAVNAAGLYLHSAGKVPPFDPTRPYSPDELEPYDALVTRFERTIEVFLRFFRTVETFETAGSGSTVRDCLGLMARLGLVQDVDAWMEMREVRNRIAHDYLPDRIKGIYDLLTVTYRPEVVAALSAARGIVRPRGIGEMRLSECERRGLVHAFADVAAPAYLIGSRLDDDRRGGDIDVLVMATGLSAEQRLRLSLRIAVRFRSVCDEKIDVHVVDPHALTDEERAFLAVVTMRPLAL